MTISLLSKRFIGFFAFILWAIGAIVVLSLEEALWRLLFIGEDSLLPGMYVWYVGIFLLACYIVFGSLHAIYQMRNHVPAKDYFLLVLIIGFGIVAALPVVVFTIMDVAQYGFYGEAIAEAVNSRMETNGEFSILSGAYSLSVAFLGAVTYVVAWTVYLLGILAIYSISFYILYKRITQQS